MTTLSGLQVFRLVLSHFSNDKKRRRAFAVLKSPYSSTFSSMHVSNLASKMRSNSAYFFSRGGKNVWFAEAVELLFKPKSEKVQGLVFKSIKMSSFASHCSYLTVIDP